MIAITVEERKEILKKYPNVHIARTMRQKSKRHHYYMEETPGPMRLLRNLREGSIGGTGTPSIGK